MDNFTIDSLSNAHHSFLEALKETGFEYLANEIVQNEDILRRENKELSNVEPHAGGLVVHEIGMIFDVIVSPNENKIKIKSDILI